MKITRKYENRMCFSDLKMGDVFAYENIIYIKTEILSPSTCANAVNLGNGLWSVFNLDDLVEKVDAELIIKDVGD